MATLSALVSGLDAELTRWVTRTRRWSGTGAAGTAWRGSSLPVASRSSPWTWRRRGSARQTLSLTPERSQPGQLRYAQRSIPNAALTRHNRPTLRIIQHCS